MKWVCKKKPLLLGVIPGLPNQVFPRFHCLNKTTPSHYNKVSDLFHFRGRDKWNIAKLSHKPVVYCSIFEIKNHPNLEGRMLNYKKLVFEEFLIHIIQWQKGMKYIKY